MVNGANKGVQTEQPYVLHLQLFIYVNRYFYYQFQKETQSIYS